MRFVLVILPVLVAGLWWRYNSHDPARVLEWHRMPCERVISVERVGEGVRGVLCSDGNRYALSAQISCAETALCAFVEADCYDVERVVSAQSHGELAGMRYLEHMTGGARFDERVPMIVALHPMDGDPADFLQQLRRYPRRARLVLPYGHANGGKYLWYHSVSPDVAASVVRQEADRIVALLAALVAARPTIGKPIVTGFSQGGIMTFALAVTHPEAIAAAFPISGLLPTSLYPSATLRVTALPAVTAFHGAADLAVPTESARASVAELSRAGHRAELRTYAGIAHDISDSEADEIFEWIARAADGL